jgi:predicted secreted protein
MPVVSMGTTFKKSGGSNIAGLTSIDGISASLDPLETTALDTTGGYRTFIASPLKDGGEVTISGHYETSQSALFTEFNTPTTPPPSYIITFPSGNTWTFPAVISAFSTSIELEDLVGFECTLKVAGAPVLA